MPNGNPAASPPPIFFVPGDSVVWGQGLLEPDKFYSRVFADFQGRNTNGVLVRAAHSGATIDTDDGSPNVPAPGEIPKTKPTIRQECDSFIGDPSAVRLILLDGGINDVKVEKIVSPFTSSSALHQAIELYCYVHMTTLLTTLAGKFAHPDCQVIVVGYYPILSEASEPLSIPLLLEALGHDFDIAQTLTDRGFILSDPVDLALQFWHESDEALQHAVYQANQIAGGRVTFVSPGFTPDNSLFAPASCLWELNPDLSAQDPMRATREQQCQQYAPAFPQSVICARASVGHPNVTGAQKYADAILRVL
jgi:hypothetical protein